MKKLLSGIFATLVGFSVLAGVSAQDQFAKDIAALEAEWQSLHQQGTAAANPQEYLKLAQQAASLASRYPRKVEPMIWETVIAAGYVRAVQEQAPAAGYDDWNDWVEHLRKRQPSQG